MIEDIKGIFEEAILAGGTGQNVMVVGDRDGVVHVDGGNRFVDSWTGIVTLDNQGNSENTRRCWMSVHGKPTAQSAKLARASVSLESSNFAMRESSTSPTGPFY